MKNVFAATTTTNNRIQTSNIYLSDISISAWATQKKNRKIIIINESHRKEKNLEIDISRIESSKKKKIQQTFSFSSIKVT